MYGILRILACDCTACPDVCDGTRARLEQEAMMQQAKLEEAIGFALLWVIVMLIVVLMVLVMRLVLMKNKEKKLD